MEECVFFDEIEIELRYKQKLILLDEMVEKDDAEEAAQFGEDIVNHIPAGDQMIRERIVGLVYYFYAKSAVKSENYEKGWPFIIKALSCLQEFGNTLMLAKIYLLLGEIVSELDDQASAIESFLTVIDIGEEKKFPVEVAKAYFYYGEILVQACHYEQGEKAFISCIELCIKDGALVGVLVPIYGRALSGAAFCLWKQNKNEKATKYYKKLIWFSRSKEGKECSCVEIKIFNILYESMYGQQVQLNKAIDEFCALPQGWEPSKSNKIAVGLAMKYLISSDKIKIAKRILLWMEDHCVSKKMETSFPWLAEIKMAILLEEDDDQEAIYQAGEELIKLELQGKKKKNNSFHKLSMMRSEMHRVEQREFEIKMMNEHLLSETMHDSMTGLPNRTFFAEYAHQLLESIKDSDEMCVVGLMDVDCFKLMNDTYGHVVGDESIILIGKTLKECCGSNLFCSRYGGDEFVVIGTGFTKTQIEEWAKELKRKIQLLDIKNSLSPVEPYITLSQGYFIYPMKKPMNLWRYLTAADNQMYKIKRTTKNGYLVSDQIDVTQGDQNDTVTGEIVY
jgi:diguanylate cyclase (GGDEF)-like protein